MIVLSHFKAFISSGCGDNKFVGYIWWISCMKYLNWAMVKVIELVNTLLFWAKLVDMELDFTVNHLK